MTNQQNKLHMLKLLMESIYTTTPQLLNMWPCKLKLGESKSKHVNLAHQNGFGLNIFA